MPLKDAESVATGVRVELDATKQQLHASREAHESTKTSILAVEEEKLVLSKALADTKAEVTAARAEL
eukprot:4634355-Prymnesium_polylepis.1